MLVTQAVTISVTQINLRVSVKINYYKMFRHRSMLLDHRNFDTKNNF